MPKIELNKQVIITFKFRSSEAQRHDQIKLSILLTPPVSTKNIRTSNKQVAQTETSDEQFFNAITSIYLQILQRSKCIL